MGPVLAEKKSAQPETESPRAAQEVGSSPGGAPAGLPLFLQAEEAEAVPTAGTALTISSPDDPAEQEAERLAEPLADLLAGGAAGDSAGEPPPEARPGGRLQRQAQPGGAAAAAVPSPLGGLRIGSGEPLGASQRASLQPRFAAGLERVQIHRDGRAAAAAEAVDALAFTVGDHIVFGAGQFSPESAEGRRLLGHELTHVLQQRQAPQALQRKKRRPKPPPKSGGVHSEPAEPRDAFAGKTYDTKTKQGALAYAQDWHTQLLWQLGEYSTEGADLEQYLLAGRTFWIYTEHYWPKLKESAEDTPAVEVMVAVGKAVEAASEEASTEASAATRIEPGRHRTLFPNTYAKEYDDEATRLRAAGKEAHQVGEERKVKYVADKEQFLLWGEIQYYEQFTAELLEAEAARIRQGKWDVFNLEEHKLWFRLDGREKARALAEQEYPAYVARAAAPHTTWDTALQNQWGGDLGKQSTEALRDLVGIEVMASQLRTSLGNQVLSPGVITAWSAADLQMLMLAPTARQGQVSDASRAAVATSVAIFYQAFRDEVKGMDRETRETVMTGPRSVGEVRTTENPYFTPAQLSYLVPAIARASTPQEWKWVYRHYNDIVGALDRYIADKLKQQGRAEEGEQLKAAGLMARELANLLTDHPDAKKVAATFYPEDELENVGQPGTPEFRARGYPLSFYLYREDGVFADNVWYLADITTPHLPRVNNESGGTSTTPPLSLFEDLNSKLRFPKGKLYWSLPDGSYWSLRTTEPWRLSEWLSWIGLGVALIGLTVATFGAATPATVIFVTAGLLGAGAAVADVVEKSEAGVLTTQDIVINALTFVGSLAGAGAAAAGRVVATGALKTADAAKWALLADKAFVPLAWSAVGTDLLSFAVFVPGALDSLEAIDKLPMGEGDRTLAKARVVGQLLLSGGLIILSVQGGLPGWSKSRNLYLDAEPDGTLIARPLLSQDELLKAAKDLQKPAEITALLGRTDLPRESLERIQASLSQSLTVGPVGASKLEELIGRLRQATKVEDVNEILLELTSRSRLGVHLGPAAAARLDFDEVKVLNQLELGTLLAIKDSSPALLRTIVSVAKADPTLLTARQSAEALDGSLQSSGLRLTWPEVLLIHAVPYRAVGQPIPFQSRESLEAFLDAIWADRQGVLQRASARQQAGKEASGAVYGEYRRATEPNPLATPEGEFLQDLRLLRDRRPAGARFGQQSAPATGFQHFVREGADVLKTTERIYLNTQADRTTAVMEDVVREIVDQPARFPGVTEAKVAGPRSVSGRPETIVIYLESREAAEQVLEELAAYQARHPDFFLTSTPPMTERVLRGVGVGAEPIVPAGADRISFGEARSDVIYRALTESVAASETRDQFLRRVLAGLEEAGIDPNAPHRNLPPPTAP